MAGYHGRDGEITTYLTKYTNGHKKELMKAKSGLLKVF